MHIDPDGALVNLSKLLTHIPQASYNLLQYLSRFLLEVTQHEQSNKMTAMNLATVFMHSIIRPEDDDPALLMGTANGRTQVCFILISKCNEIFKMEYTELGNTVHVGKLLDLDGGSQAAPASFNPDSSYKPVQPSKRLTQLLDINVLAEEPGYSLPLPLSPNSPSIKIDANAEDNPYHVPYGALPENDPLSIENRRETSPVYAEIASPIHDRPDLRTKCTSPPWGSIQGPTPPPRNSMQGPSPPPRPNRLSSKVSIDSVTSEVLQVDNKEDEAINALVSTDTSDFSPDDLHAHIEALCNQLLSQRSKVRLLQDDLHSVKARHKQKLHDMAQKLNTERTGTAEAVDRVVKLQAELQRYQMKYEHIQG